jgi:hypothetical protein
MATNSSYVGWGKENKWGLEQNEMNEAVGTDIYLGHYLLYPFHHGELSGLCYLQKIDTDRINPSWSQKVRYCGTCGSQLDITLFNPILTTLSAWSVMMDKDNLAVGGVLHLLDVFSSSFRGHGLCPHPLRQKGQSNNRKWMFLAEPWPGIGVGKHWNFAIERTGTLLHSIQSRNNLV